MVARAEILLEPRQQNFSRLGPAADQGAAGRPASCVARAGVSAKLLSATGASAAALTNPRRVIEVIHPSVAALTGQACRRDDNSAGNIDSLQADDINGARAIYGAPAAVPSPTDVLAAGARLTRGQTLTFVNRRYRLVYQTDGNVVIYSVNVQPLWGTR